MKFTKGYWMNRPGVEISDVVQIREAVQEGDRLYLYTVPYGYDGRAMGGPVIEMYISAPRENILRMEAWHLMGGRQKEPAFALHLLGEPICCSGSVCMAWCGPWLFIFRAGWAGHP